MASDVIKKLLIRNFSEFEFAFNQAKSVYVNDKGKRFHELEYGEYRERVLLKLLKTILPSRFDIGTGFIVNTKNEISTQCDLIIYDKNETPDFEGDYGQRFFPVESVVGVGEVKSTIQDVKTLNDYLNKLAKIASLKNELGDAVMVDDSNHRGNPQLEPRDSIFTFLVCSELSFKFYSNKITEQCNVTNKVNCILSVNDGLACRKLPDGNNYHQPAHGKHGALDLGFIESNEEEFKKHFKYFTSLIRLMAESAHVYKVDVSEYIFDNDQISR
ncbi:DUF6602 domain-containing protein [Vibrio alginolyticus]